MTQVKDHRIQAKTAGWMGERTTPAPFIAVVDPSTVCLHLSLPVFSWSAFAPRYSVALFATSLVQLSAFGSSVVLHGAML